MEDPDINDVLARSRRFERKGDEPLPDDVQRDAFRLMMEARERGDTEAVKRLLAAAE